MKRFTSIDETALFSGVLLTILSDIRARENSIENEYEKNLIPAYHLRHIRSEISCNTNPKTFSPLSPIT
jgi:hypothetical protein